MYLKYFPADYIKIIFTCSTKLKQSDESDFKIQYNCKVMNIKVNIHYNKVINVFFCQTLQILKI